MRKFSKRFVFFVLPIIIMSLAGCALFQKPPADPNEKKAWVDSSKAALDNAATGECIALVAFTVFCTAGNIDEATCAIGNVLDVTWQTDYLAAKDALDKYGRDEITQIEAQRHFDQAMLKSLAGVSAFLRTKSAEPAAAEAMTVRGDLTLPEGQTKGLKK